MRPRALVNTATQCAMGVLMFIVILAGSLLNLKIRTEEALG